MTEPVLPLVGFALGVVGFVGTIRNLAQRLVEDVDNFQQDHKNISALLNRSQFVVNHLTLWQRRWFIDDQTSDALLSDYWGEDMIPVIRNSLEIIDTQTHDIEEEIRTRYGVCRKDLQDAQEGWHQLDTEELLKRKPSSGRRLKNVIFEDSTFAKHFNNLENAVDRLDQMTKSQFLVRHGQRSEEGWEKAIEDIALRRFLNQLLPSTASEFDCLHRKFSALEGHLCELRLSHGTSPLERLTTLKACASKEYLEYHLLVSNNGIANPDQVRSLSCRRSEGQESFAHPEDIEQLFNSIGIILLTNTHLFLAGSYKYRLLKSQGNYKPSQTLRTYIRETSCNYNKRLHGAFTKRQRTQVAYEVAECAYLFLTRELLSSMCSCGIGRTQSRPSVEEFTFRFGKILHHRSEPWYLQDRGSHTSIHRYVPLSLGFGLLSVSLDSLLVGLVFLSISICLLLAGIPSDRAVDHHVQPWCSRNGWRQTPIRRFGLLLVEICLGKIVYDVNDVDTAESLNLDLDSDIVEAARGLGKDVIVNLVRQEAGDDLSGVIEYCLMQDSPLDNVDEEVLEEFFDQVILPLWIQYDNVVIGMSRLQLSRQSVNRVIQH